jgi:hypothetical protein
MQKIANDKKIELEEAKEQTLKTISFGNNKINGGGGSCSCGNCGGGCGHCGSCGQCGCKYSGINQ